MGFAAAAELSNPVPSQGIQLGTLSYYNIPNSYVPFLYFNTPGTFLGIENDRNPKDLLLWEGLQTKYEGKVCGSSSVLEQTLPNQKFSMDLRKQGWY